jgi:hypothetical protein
MPRTPTHDMTAEVQADLVVPVEIVPQLRLSLLADMRSLGAHVLERTPVALAGQ